MSGSAGMSRLERAMQLFVDFRSQDEETAAELLARHADLRDLLEPMLSAPTAESTARDHAEVLGDFRLVREIGRGGMGIVYEAQQITLDRRVALKVLSGHLAQDHAAIARFKREALTAAQLEHPGIVKILTVGSAGDVHFFAMELIAGAPLGGKLRPARCVAIAAQVADALAVAHAHGVIHRDVKPANILVRDDGTAVLTDFGLARQASAPSLTRTGAHAGTPYYMSPEQILAGKDGVDHRSDIFSLGVTLYEILTHERPFEGTSSQAVLENILHRDPRDPQLVNPDLSPELAAIVLKALEKDPAQRYATAAALADDLRAFLAYRPVSARRISRLKRVRRWIKREPFRAAFVGVLVLAVPAVASLGGYLLATAHAVRVGHEKETRDEVERALAEGFMDLVEGSADQALAWFAKVQDLEPANPEALGGVTLVHLRRNEIAAGLALLDRHARVTHDTAALERLRGLLLHRAGQPEQSAEVLARIGPPHEALDLYLEGLREMDRGEHEIPDGFRQALKLLSKAVRVAPVARACFHIQWSHAAGHTGDTLSIEESCVALEQLWPTSALASWSVGFALQGVDLTRALAAQKRALDLDERFWRAHAALGTLLARSGDTAGALREWSRSIDLHANDRESWFNIGLCRTHDDDTPGAMAAYRAAIAIDAGFVAARINLSGLLEQSGDPVHAIQELAVATENTPGSVLAHHALASLLYRTGHATAAVAEYQRVLVLDPHHAPTLVNLGGLLDEAGYRLQALACWRRAAGDAPRLEEAHLNLVDLLTEMKNPSELRIELERWSAVQPDDAVAHNNLAWFLVDPDGRDEQRDPVLGLREARRANELTHGDNADILATLAEAEFASGDLVAATHTLELALAALPAQGDHAARTRADLLAASDRFQHAPPVRPQRGPDSGR